MAIFTAYEPETRQPKRGRGRIGWGLIGVALVAVTAIALVPSPYVIEQPGPVFDTLGNVEVDGSDVPLIEIPDEETYPTEGSLSMLTVSIDGNREHPASWFDTALAWLDPSKAVVPLDSVYPVGVTVEDSNEQGEIDMQNSQQEAIAAALTSLDYDVTSELVVASTSEDTPADGVLEVGDIIDSVNGESFEDVTALRAAIADNGTEKDATVVVTRDGTKKTVKLTPIEGDDGAVILGIGVGGKYDFPFDVTIQLENVGGPSAGQMFALGIIDKLTPGSLAGGADVAGTGTISGAGEIGAIGGIRQKMYGAVRGGAEYFLAPESNCDEVTGHIPDGLTVFAVGTLDDSLAALEVVADGGDTSALPTCPAG